VALIEADLPKGALFHIGRTPNVLAWAEWAYVGGGRFDAPARLGKFRVLYAAEQRLAAFVETLQKWRPSIEALAALESVTIGSGPTPASERDMGRKPEDWRLKRGIGMLRLLPNQRWLDLRRHETRESLRATRTNPAFTGAR
jgi:hypothetical protein